MGRQFQPKEDPGLYLDLGAVEDGAVLGQVEGPALAGRAEHVEGGEAEVPLLQQPRDESSDGLPRVGGDHGGGLVREDDPCEGAASLI